MTFYALVAVTLARASSAWPCSVCFGGTGDDIAGYNASVFFLMATPYLVFGTIVGGLIFTYRRALKKRERAESEIQLAWNQEESGR